MQPLGLIVHMPSFVVCTVQWVQRLRFRGRYGAGGVLVVRVQQAKLSCRVQLRCGGRYVMVEERTSRMLQALVLCRIQCFKMLTCSAAVARHSAAKPMRGLLKLQTGLLVVTGAVMVSASVCMPSVVVCTVKWMQRSGCGGRYGMVDVLVVRVQQAQVSCRMHLRCGGQ